MHVVTEIVRVVMQLGAGAFAGACVYIALAQHPVRMGLADAAALDDFRSTIPRAERLQAPLLVVTLVATALSLVLTFRGPVLVGGVLLLAVLVQTIVTVLPVNARLLSGAAADHVGEARTALSRWGALHTVRTAVAVLGAVLVLL